MSKVKTKKWNMRPETRIIVSEAFKLCQEMNEKYNQKVSVRQVYYHLFTKGITKLTNDEYHRICQILTKARKRGYIPFEWIEDRSRNPLWRMLYEDLPQFFDFSKNNFRKNTWTDQDNFVIILIEKEALAPIIYDMAKEYNVFVFPTKGFSSWSMFIQDIKTLVQSFGEGKHLIVLVMSDMDPSGQHIKNDYVKKFQFMSDELGFQLPEVLRIAITKEQVEKYNIPSMKKSYRKKGILDIWELDALNPKILRSIVKEEIEKYLDLDALKESLKAEDGEKKLLQYLIDFGINSLLHRGNIGEDG